MAGRPSKYEENVKSKFSKIEEWLQIGISEKDIAERLGIHKATFVEYKKKYSELNDLIKNNRKRPVEEIKASMFKRAKGFEYKEKKVITKYIDLDDKIKEKLMEIGVDVKEMTKPKLVRIEETTKMALPSEAAGLILLQHWDKDSKGKSKWSRDPASLEMKKEELMLKQKQLENDNW